jgi:Tfp pilus assembly protein PilO
MALPLDQNYKLEYTRYRHYFHNLWSLYQKPSVKVSSALLLTLFTIIFFAAFAIRPTLVTVAELIKKIDDQRQVLEQMKKKSAALASAQQEYMSVQAKLPLINTAVPPDEAIPDLIKIIEGTAAFHQLALESLSIGDIVYADPKSPQPAGPQTRTISLSVTGTYDSINTFLKDLQRLPRLSTLETVNFSPPKDAQTQTGGPIQITVSFKVHYLPRDDSLSP